MRKIPPAERYPKSHQLFSELDSGERLQLVNDHDPKPLFYEMDAELDGFDADG